MSMNPTPPLPAAPLVTIGDIAVTQNDYLTPSGVFPLAGTQWMQIGDIHQRVNYVRTLVAALG